MKTRFQFNLRDLAFLFAAISVFLGLARVQFLMWPPNTMTWIWLTWLIWTFFLSWQVSLAAWLAFTGEEQAARTQAAQGIYNGLVPIAIVVGIQVFGVMDEKYQLGIDDRIVLLILGLSHFALVINAVVSGFAFRKRALSAGIFVVRLLSGLNSAGPATLACLAILKVL